MPEKDGLEGWPFKRGVFTEGDHCNSIFITVPKQHGFYTVVNHILNLECVAQ